MAGESERSTEELAGDFIAALQQTQAEGASVQFDTGAKRGRKPAAPAAAPAPAESAPEPLPVSGQDVAVVLCSFATFFFQRLNLPAVTTQEQAALGNSLDLVLQKYSDSFSKVAPEVLLLGSVAAIAGPRYLEYQAKKPRDVSNLSLVPRTISPEVKS